jgi:hypothetical protein
MIDRIGSIALHELHGEQSAPLCSGASCSLSFASLLPGDGGPPEGGIPNFGETRAEIPQTRPRRGQTQRRFYSGSSTTSTATRWLWRDAAASIILRMA